MQASIAAMLKWLVLPWGKTSGKRMVMDGISGGIKIYDEHDDLVAEVGPEVGPDGAASAGLWTRGFQAPENITSTLTGGQLQFGTVDPGAIGQGGSVSYTGGGSASTLTLLSGTVAGTSTPARLELSSAGTVQRATVHGDAQVTGSLRAGNIRVGTVTTAAPGAGGGVTTAAVTFNPPLPATPIVTITTRSAANPETVTINAFTDALSSSGFTVRCYRSSNTATVHAYIAICP